jgi:para-nitrobenzyl esterase
MVWIHGGANVWGRSSSYDGSHLAGNEDVIVVAVQYRLGPLGWFAHEALRETAVNTEDSAASFATLDLIASLKWLRENIATFGGNPGNVTIFGQSAGGHNVATLLASPLAKGLFHRAIIQSGSFDSVSLEEAENGGDGFFTSSKDVAGKLKATSASDLRKIPVEQLLAVYRPDNGGFINCPKVIEDGVALPAEPLRELFASTETFNCVPIITGATRDEMKLFYLGNPEMTKKVMGKLIVARDQEFYDSISHYLSRLWKIRAVNEPASMMFAAGHKDVYAYRFDWDDGGHFGPTDLKDILGAAHGVDMPFVFNRFPHKTPGDKLLFTRKTREACETLSRSMGSYWASFAREGIPSCQGEAGWPVFGSERYCLRFDTASTTDAGIEVRKNNDSLGLLASDLMNDERIDDRERQLIVKELDNWMFSRPVREDIEAAMERSLIPS